MEGFTEHNEEVCEKYSRFVVEVFYQEQEFYTIWSADKVLVDEEGCFLLFTEIEDAIDFARQTERAIDKGVFPGWLAEIKLPIESDSVIDIELLNTDSIDIADIDLLNETISDYCCQIEDEQWMDAFSGYPLWNFFDAFMGRHFWTGVEKPEPITDKLLTDVVQKHKELYQFIESRIKIM